MDFRPEQHHTDPNWSARDFTDCLVQGGGTQPVFDLDKAINEAEAAYQARSAPPAPSTPADTVLDSASTSLDDVKPIALATSPPDLFDDSLTPPFTPFNSLADGPLVGSGMAVIESEKVIPRLPLLPQVESGSGQLVPFENQLQLSGDGPSGFMGIGFAIEKMSQFVQGPLANFMVGTAQQLSRNSSTIQQNTHTISRLQKRQTQLEKALIKMGNLDKQTFKTAARPQAQTEFLAHLIYNGIQTKVGFVSIIFYEPEEFDQPQVVVSVAAIAQLFKRVGRGPSTLGKTRDTLSQAGFGDCHCFTEGDFDSLFSLFCLHEPQSPSAKQRRLMMMDSKTFFGLLVNIPDVERKKVRDVKAAQFKKHAYTEGEWKHPGINTAFWKEVFGIWSVELETFMNRARRAMGQQLDSSLDMGKRPYHLHGIKPVGFDVDEYSCVMTAKARGKTGRRTRRGRGT